MADVLYALEATVGEVQAWLDANLPPSVTVHLRRVPATATAPFVLVGEAPGTGRTDGPPMAGDQTADILIDVTSIGQVDSQALGLANTVHRLLVGRLGNGTFETALPLTGLRVIDRACEDRSGLRLDVPVPQCLDTYRIRVSRA